MNIKVVFCVVYGCSVLECVAKLSSEIESHERTEILSRNVRVTSYIPYQSGISSTVGLDIPVDNGRGDIFISFCLSLAYGQPEYNTPDGIDPHPHKTIYGETVDSRKRSNRNTFLTRRKFFRVFADNLNKKGFNANHCILKAICETAQYQFGNENGLLGDIIHILFTPTTSKNEGLPTRFYEAEMNGQLNLCEKKYDTNCPISIFDLITIMK